MAAPSTQVPCIGSKLIAHNTIISSRPLHMSAVYAYISTLPYNLRSVMAIIHAGVVMERCSGQGNKVLWDPIDALV